MEYEIKIKSSNLRDILKQLRRLTGLSEPTELLEPKELVISPNSTIQSISPVKSPGAMPSPVASAPTVQPAPPVSPRKIKSIVNIIKKTIGEGWCKDTIRCIMMYNMIYRLNNMNYLTPHFNGMIGFIVVLLTNSFLECLELNKEQLEKKRYETPNDKFNKFTNLLEMKESKILLTPYHVKSFVGGSGIVGLLSPESIDSKYKTIISKKTKENDPDSLASFKLLLYLYEMYSNLKLGDNDDINKAVQFIMFFMENAFMELYDFDIKMQKDAKIKAIDINVANIKKIITIVEHHNIVVASKTAPVIGERESEGKDDFTLRKYKKLSSYANKYKIYYDDI
jgi:hypothetical protein